MCPANHLFLLFCLMKFPSAYYKFACAEFLQRLRMICVYNEQDASAPIVLQALNSSVKVTYL